MRDLTTLPSSIAEKIRKSEDIRNLKRDIESGYHVPEVNLPSRLNSASMYNYKIKITGDFAESILYSKPIAFGYTRKHKPERREGRTMANEQNIKRARRNVHDIVNTNYTEYTKMITLTYAETMLDYDRLYLDFKHFKEALKRQGYDFPYLAITEHQTKRGEKEGNAGSLHIHALLFTDTYIPFLTIKKCWGVRGSVHIEKVDKATNKGAYVSKYITKEGCPADKKSYRTSRNIKRPTRKIGLGNELDVITTMQKRFNFKSQYDYTVPRGTNQDTGEVFEDTIATVTQFQSKRIKS